MDFELYKESDRKDTIPVPESIIEYHLSAIKGHEGIESREDYEEWYREDYEKWQSHLEEGLGDRLEDADGNLVPKEEALFLERWHMSRSPAMGGHSMSSSANFEDEGNEYGIITFCWGGTTMEEWRIPYIMAYKEDGED